MPFKFTLLEKLKDATTLKNEIEKDFGKEGLEILTKSELKLKMKYLDFSAEDPIDRMKWEKNKVREFDGLGGVCYKLKFMVEREEMGKKHIIGSTNEAVLGYKVKGAEVSSERMKNPDEFCARYHTMIDLITKENKVIRFAFNHE
jgi:hypothetical protein